MITPPYSYRIGAAIAGWQVALNAIAKTKERASGTVLFAISMGCSLVQRLLARAGHDSPRSERRQRQLLADGTANTGRPLGE